MPTKRPLPVLLPQRSRRPPRSFGWIDHRLRSDGFLDGMSPEEMGLYLFLALAADKDGLSCWRLDTIARDMPCFDVAALKRARDGLVRQELVAFRPWGPKSIDGSYQVLSLPTADPAVGGETEAPRAGGVSSIGETFAELLGERRRAR